MVTVTSQALIMSRFYMTAGKALR